MSPEADESPCVQMRCLTVNPIGQVVFVMSPAGPGIDPRHMAARIEAQILVQLRSVVADHVGVA